LIVCEHCDRVYQRPALDLRQKAQCTVCGQKLKCFASFHSERTLALSMTVAIVFMLAMVNPVIHVTVMGQHSEATLWQAVMSLAQGVGAPIALPVMLILFVPLAQSLLQCWVLAFDLNGIRAPKFALVMRSIGWLRPWSMVEVCLLSVLIAMIKLSGYLDVHPGSGLWALAVLTFLNGMLCTQDLCALWERRS
jgi:paraquat-inducible protein A